MGVKVTGQPAAWSASAKAFPVAKGITGSASPWRIHKGRFGPETVRSRVPLNASKPELMP